MPVYLLVMQIHVFKHISTINSRKELYLTLNKNQYISLYF